MLSRIIRSAVTLATLVVVYQVYVLTVAPIVEPPAIEKSVSKITEEQKQQSYQAIGRYRPMLAAYFPAGHWALAEPAPIVLRFDKLMLVLKDYRRHDDGSVDLDQCAVLVLPADWQFGAPPPRETVVLEAPGGAHLQFDEDFQPTRGKAGRIVAGKFPGQIVIRSDMKLPGPEDDLLITTRDLVMNETLIHTDAKVAARFGSNRGIGRKMVIRLNRDKHIKRGPSINGVQSLEIMEQVELELEPGKVDLLGEEAPSDKVARVRTPRGATTIQLTSANEPAAEFNPPIRLTCRGRFHFDLLNYIASFDQQVEIRRMRLDGPFDSLDCNELSIQFSAIDEDGAPINSDDPDVARRQRKAMGRFEPVFLTATGHPVRAESAVQGASARANRMRINLHARRITLDEGNDVMLAYGRSEIHAPYIEYQLPEQKSPSAVGELSVAGPGWLRAVPDKERDDRIVDLSWKASASTKFPLRLTRRNGQPVLLLAGHPVVDAHRLGKISARQMEVQLREVPSDGPDGPALELTNAKTKLAIIPERLLASDQVVFASPKLTGRTHQLEGNFEAWSPQGALSTNEATAREVSDRKQLQTPSDKPPSSQYDLSANQIHLDLTLSGKSADPTRVTCDGSVVLRETRTAKPDEAPLAVKGQRLTVRDLDTNAKITVIGRRDPQLGGPGTATIEARGMTLAAERINADQTNSKFWINGPGLATMNVDGEMFGEQAGTTVPVTLTWQTGLDAAGRRIVASGRVLAESQRGWVQADRVVALLTRSISMEEDSARDEIEVAQVSLEGKVAGDYRDGDEKGQTSHESFQLKSIAYNHQTGAIQGVGPGVLRSVRLSDSSASFANLAGGSATTQGAPKPRDSEPQLRFLRVDFAQGLSGNANQRIVRFHRRVQSVYGPVDDWRRELPLHAPDRLPPDTVTLACETLEVNEDPLGRPAAGAKKRRMGPLEVRAVENVEIEGRSEKDGTFQAQANAASYSQLKDLFVLRGDELQDAVLRHRDPLSGRYVTTPAGTILYYRSEPRVELRDVHRPIDFQQTAPRGATGRRPASAGPIR